jgi:hypothetical protein
METDAFRRLLQRMGENRWGWTREELPEVLERFGWTRVLDDELGVTVDLGPDFAGSAKTTARVPWIHGPVMCTTLVLARGDAADPADALRLGDDFERRLGIATEVLGTPSDRLSGPRQVASWRGHDERGTVQLVQHRSAVTLRWSSNVAQATQDGRDAKRRPEQAAQFARIVRPDPDGHVDGSVEPEPPEVSGERLIEHVLTEDPSWERFARVFVRALLRLRNGSSLILYRSIGDYVQFQYSTGHADSFCLEVSCNAVREEYAQLTEADEELLRELGYAGADPAFPNENWRIQQNRVIDADLAEQLAGQAVRALREVVRAERPADLSVKAFNAFA